MVEKRTKNLLQLAMICLFLVSAILVPYAWAYYTTVTPMAGSTHRSGGLGEGYVVYKSKPFANWLASHECYGPIHWLDRKLRPHVSNPPTK